MLLCGYNAARYYRYPLILTPMLLGVALASIVLAAWWQRGRRGSFWRVAGGGGRLSVAEGRPGHWDRTIFRPGQIVDVRVVQTRPFHLELRLMTVQGAVHRRPDDFDPPEAAALARLLRDALELPRLIDLRRAHLAWIHTTPAIVRADAPPVLPYAAPAAAYHEPPPQPKPRRHVTVGRDPGVFTVTIARELDTPAMITLSPQRLRVAQGRVVEFDCDEVVGIWAERHRRTTVLKVGTVSERFRTVIAAVGGQFALGDYRAAAQLVSDAMLLPRANPIDLPP
jgi:hypothetical protein